MRLPVSTSIENCASAAPLLEVEDLSVVFKQGRGQPPLRASDHVGLTVGHGETVGLVGESGSGKSTIGRAVLGLAPVASGRIRFGGQDITHAGFKERRALSARLQVVFQDPYSSLNPARTIGQTLAEPLLVHRKLSSADLAAAIAATLVRVGLPADAAGKYPSQFSGGQRQRIAIARALIIEPQLIVCDEPLSALDLSIQAHVLNLLTQLQKDTQVSYLFISHDIPLVRHLCHRMVVLYRGQIMESGPSRDVYSTPRHPYTRALLASVPNPDPRVQKRRAAPVTVVAGPVLVQGGCPFQDRCPHVFDRCHTERPVPRVVGTQTVSCHRAEELAVGPLTATGSTGGI
jgi:oligopeptide/dipeptide ABC transporter ATP-binding protein